MTAQNLKMYNITTRQLPFSYATADSDSAFETSIDVDLKPTTYYSRDKASSFESPCRSNDEVPSHIISTQEADKKKY